MLCTCQYAANLDSSWASARDGEARGGAGRVEMTHLEASSGMALSKAALAVNPRQVGCNEKV